MRSMHPKTFLSLFQFLLFLVTLLHPFQTSNAEESIITSQEYRLKAVCLYNFTQFTVWPDVKDINKSEHISLSVVGESPFGKAFQELQASLIRKQKKNIRITYHGPYRDGLKLQESHLLFISASEKQNMKKILTNLGNAPVLTVSDTDDFLEAGGMISLVLLDNKIRWEVNRTAIEMAGIGVSVKLLQLALRVDHPPEQSENLQNELNWKIHSSPSPQKMVSRLENHLP